MENKEAKSEGKELRTAFNSPKFMSVLETLKAAQDAIESLSSCYDEGDRMCAKHIQEQNSLKG